VAALCLINSFTPLKKFSNGVHCFLWSGREDLPTSVRHLAFLA